MINQLLRSTIALYILLLGSHMSELNQKQPLIQDQLKRTLRDLQGTFPHISQVQFDQNILTSPHLGRLSKMLQLSIPINAYSQQLQQLHSNLSKQYYQQILKIDHSSPTRITQIHTGPEAPKTDLQLQENTNRVQKGKRVKSKINYLDLANYISSFTTEQETNVSQELIHMGRAFDSWGVKQVAGPQLSKQKPQRQDSKNENSQIRMGRQKSQKTDEVKSQSVKIMLGKNISLECKEMRHQIINRANANRLLEQNTRLTQLQRIGIEINYILNRITEQYLEDFLKELKPYAQDEIYSFILSDKIIEKVMEEHNFTITYCKLVKRLRNVTVVLGGDKLLRFKNILVEKLQQNFYALIRQGQWQQKQQHYKKKLLGMSYFIGELFNNRFLSKYIFTDCFYELVRCYVLQYQKYKSNKSVFYYETYIECVVKIIERMNTEYDDLIAKQNNSDLESVLNQIIESTSQQEYSFTQICDYIQLLKKINERLPSQRFKITFLLEDFKCSAALKKEKETLNNNEYDIVKSVLSIDINIKQDANKIPEMLSRGRPQVVMKDFYYQFAEGNLKQVNKHINIFKIMAECPGICEAAVDGLKDNVDGLYSIESDFPYLCEGLAKVMKIVCDEKRLNYRQLNLGEQDHEDEDIRQFLEKIEEKYYKMIIQD